MSVQAPDLLTRLLLRVAQRQPFNRGPLRRRLAKFFEQRIHAPVETRFHGVPFEFNFDNPTEQKDWLDRPKSNSSLQQRARLFLYLSMWVPTRAFLRRFFFSTPRLKRVRLPSNPTPGCASASNATCG